MYVLKTQATIKGNIYITHGICQPFHQCWTKESVMPNYIYWRCCTTFSTLISHEVYTYVL